MLALLEARCLFDSTLTVVKWRFFNKYTFVQIGKRLGVSNNVRNWYKQGLQRLREALEDQGIKSLPKPW